MARAPGKVKESAAHYYDRRGILGELAEGGAAFALDEELRDQILRGKRTRRLENIPIKLDPAQVQAVRKIATMKAIPYQTLIRQWLGGGPRGGRRPGGRARRRRGG